MNKEYVQIIRESLSMEDVAYFYVQHADIRRHRMPCPFHHGEDDNLALYEDSYYCYVCHEHGDIFDFTQKILNVSFKDACIALNRDFNLNLPLEGKLTLRQRIAIDNHLIEIQEEHDRKRAAREDYEKRYSELMNKYSYYDRILCREPPGTEMWAIAHKYLLDLSYCIDRDL